MATFFTSDTHLGHANIIRYCKRPWLKEGDLTLEGEWASKEIARDRCFEMNEAIITNWNSVIRQNDTVYHLGDFAFGDAEKFLWRLNGYIIFVAGNHDKPLHELYPRERLPYKRVIEIDNQTIVLSHFAMRVWDKSHFNSWHLYGHSHGTLTTSGKSFDVGVDAQNFTPMSWDQVKEQMKLLPDNPNYLTKLKGFNVEEYKRECEIEGGQPIYGNHV